MAFVTLELSFQRGVQWRAAEALVRLCIFNEDMEVTGGGVSPLRPQVSRQESWNLSSLLS